MEMQVVFEIATGLIALTLMEIVLGIDNIVFITILSSRLPKEQQPSARRWGLALAMFTRIALLFCLAWLVHMQEPWFSFSQQQWLPLWFRDWLIANHEEVDAVSIRDVVLLLGGLFLLYKSVHEIHERLDEPHTEAAPKKKVSFVSVIVQIAILDIIFSLDSVITAVGMVETIWVMVAAIVMAVIVMLIFSEVIAGFIDRRPTIRILALSFLILIAVVLISEAVGTPINKGYIYFAMAFSLAMEMINLGMRPINPAYLETHDRQPTDPA